jgi:hypothetical protein
MQGNDETHYYFYIARRIGLIFLTILKNIQIEMKNISNMYFSRVKKPIKT